MINQVKRARNLYASRGLEYPRKIETSLRYLEVNIQRILHDFHCMDQGKPRSVLPLLDTDKDAVLKVNLELKGKVKIDDHGFPLTILGLGHGKVLVSDSYRRIFNVRLDSTKGKSTIIAQDLDDFIQAFDVLDDTLVCGGIDRIHILTAKRNSSKEKVYERDKNT